jgi:hypothetical protein
MDQSDEFRRQRKFLFASQRSSRLTKQVINNSKSTEMKNVKIHESAYVDDGDKQIQRDSLPKASLWGLRGDSAALRSE